MPDNTPKSSDFASLYRGTIGPLRRYLARLLGNPSDAQDVAHDAYLRVYPKVQDRSALKPEAVLYTTARRLAINRLKRRQISPVATNNDQVDAATTAIPGVVQQVVARQELAQLEQAIAQLPEGCRTVLLLRKIELLSHQEIADRLDIAVSTVEKQHARALRLLRASLARQPAAGPSLTSEARP
ncbi:sigma-70 family RNA polymerase sigma factor [Opitutus sp. GAS368]|jgi:RNA polymerase sigma factor (sigma-70 family)|uniref:RNA polymerase sigma factor n=1 Tax=Opitutus sp. GAS368 TaxID=1882749 RepID=UPI00087CFD79|nr:sigma-70 family RNA polymerase sigma factor [Opitutus sp. GAS368]SDS25235.1 RNA polymerase sigma-70 factor, ECF subfamily [Opitutus sp. GAS368]